MPDDLREIWQKQELEPMTITVDQVRQCAGTLRRRVARRNVLEYVAGGLAAASFLPMLWRNHGWELVPPVLIIAGMAWMLYQLHKRAAAPAGFIDSGVQASLALLRRQLERQRDALRSVWTWYLLPLVPGIAALMIEVAWKRGISWRYVGAVAFVACGFAAVSALNSRAARRLDGRIEEIRNMEEKDE